MTETLQAQDKKDQEKKGLTASERFTNMVMAQYSSIGPAHEFTTKEKQLIRGYFITIDQMLAKTEADRLRKNENNRDHKYDNALPYSWNTIDLPQLAQDLAHYAHVGLDMMEDNTLVPIPFKNNKGNMYTVTLMEGYNGIRYQAEKYALHPFRSVTVEVIYANDVFKPLKKSISRPFDSYEFEIPQPFDRGEPVGVFGYIEYEDSSNNKLVFFSKADVLKRKPPYASPEFWGGKKTVYENGKKVEKEMEGWLPEMFAKTMKREIYGLKHIIRDPAKVDESYNYIRQREQQYMDIAVEAEVQENGNGEPIMLPEAAQRIQPAEKHGYSLGGLSDEASDAVNDALDAELSGDGLGMYGDDSEPDF